MATVTLSMTDQEKQRASEALQNLWGLDAPATEEQLAQFCAKHMRGLVQKYEERVQQAQQAAPVPFMGK